MNDKFLSNEELINIAQLLKVIGEPNRLLLLEKIIEGIQCNCELGDSLQIAPNLISHHLSVLRDAGFINAKRDPVDSRWIYYSINPNKMDDLKAFCGEFFDKDRIQPRGAACGPRITEEQRQSMLRMSGS